MTAVDELVEAWTRWAKHPGTDRNVERLLVALNAAAPDGDGNRLRGHVAGRLREGWRLRDAIAEGIGQEVAA